MDIGSKVSWYMYKVQHTVWRLRVLTVYIEWFPPIFCVQEAWLCVCVWRRGLNMCGGVVSYIVFLQGPSEEPAHNYDEVSKDDPTVVRINSPRKNVFL